MLFRSAGAIPNTPDQWRRWQAIVLQDPVVETFAEADAEAVFRLVTEQGANLLLMTDESGGYQQALASRFGWDSAPGRLTEAVRLAAAARGLPLLKLGCDGAQSARRFAAMGGPEHTDRVPPQDVVLVETASGQPVCSLGFYGRGKVICWGIRGLYRMREYDHARLGDRLLEAVVGELAMPLWAAAEGPACYPPMPVAGSPNWLVVQGSGAGEALATGARSPIALAPRATNRLGILEPNEAKVTVTADGGTAAFATSDNAGMERIYQEFDESFLRRLAEQAGGHYRWAPEALAELNTIEPRMARTAEARVFPVGRHPAVLTAIVVLSGVHWVFRKLAGMAI
mgnify:CR=1 FL=1